MDDCGSSVISFAAKPQKRMARTMFLPTPMRAGASSRVKIRGSAPEKAQALRNHP